MSADNDTIQRFADAVGCEFRDDYRPAGGPEDCPCIIVPAGLSPYPLALAATMQGIVGRAVKMAGFGFGTVIFWLPPPDRAGVAENPLTCAACWMIVAAGKPIVVRGGEPYHAACASDCSRRPW